MVIVDETDGCLTFEFEPKDVMAAVCAADPRLQVDIEDCALGTCSIHMVIGPAKGVPRRWQTDQEHATSELRRICNLDILIDHYDMDNEESLAKLHQNIAEAVRIFRHCTGLRKLHVEFREEDADSCFDTPDPDSLADKHWCELFDNGEKVTLRKRPGYTGEGQSIVRYLLEPFIDLQVCTATRIEGPYHLEGDFREYEALEGFLQALKFWTEGERNHPFVEMEQQCILKVAASFLTDYM